MGLEWDLVEVAVCLEFVTGEGDAHGPGVGREGGLDTEVQESGRGRSVSPSVVKFQPVKSVICHWRR